MTTVHDWHKNTGHYIADTRRKEVRIYGGDLEHADGRILEKCVPGIKPQTVTPKEFDNILEFGTPDGGKPLTP